MLRSDLCDYKDAYIAMGRKIDLGVFGNNDMTEKDSVFKNNAPFWSCITKINNIFIDNAKDLDIVMPMHNLLVQSNYYFMTSESFGNYFRDDVDNPNDNASDSKSFKYKIKITGKTEVKPAQVGNGRNTN